MKKTKVVNCTGRSIVLKEGTGGVYRMLCSDLKDKSSFTFKFDPNATYREYWCAVTSDDEKHVVLSSDDCTEYKEVHIQLKSDNTYTWDAVKRDSHEFVKDAGQPWAQERQALPSTSDSGPSFVGKAWKKIMVWFL